MFSRQWGLFDYQTGARRRFQELVGNTSQEEAFDAAEPPCPANDEIDVVGLGEVKHFSGRVFPEKRGLHLLQSERPCSIYQFRPIFKLLHVTDNLEPVHHHPIDVLEIATRPVRLTIDDKSTEKSTKIRPLIRGIYPRPPMAVLILVTNALPAQT